MTNEEIATKAEQDIEFIVRNNLNTDVHEEVKQRILAAINRAQSEDKADEDDADEDDAEFEAWWQKFRNHIDMDGETKSDCKLAWKAARKRLGIHKTK